MARTHGSTATLTIPIQAILDAHPLKEKAVIEVRRKWLEEVERSLGVKFQIEDRRPTLVPTSLETTIVNGTIDKSSTAGPKAENVMVAEEID